MITTNYHTHTYFCDGSAEPGKYVLEAIHRELTSLGFSAHAPLPFQTTWNLAEANLGPYCGEINRLKQKYKEQIEIYLSLEIDYIPGVSQSFDLYSKNYNLDYTLGAVHLVKSPESKEIWFIDGPASNYDNGLKKIFKNDIQQAVAAYYTQLNEMIITQKPDIIAHFDKIKMNNRGRFFGENDAWYKKLLSQTIEIIAQSGCMVEVNTRGIYTGKCDSLYPGIEALKQCFDLKIPVTISSDAHKPTDINSYFEETEMVLKRIGFQNIRILKDGQWVDKAI
ncbi:MAG: histidinol-phosphatase [Bacteroidales bacterium]|jgi:histidinol-phosphatase (PHP family)|nr:histidinol-phosphatase [Bacteroidales bacterium]MDD4213430.1 histidinol-phosphatase [Bacteroidales bacterium]